MKNDMMDNRLSLANNRFKIPDSKLLMGSIIGKYPVIFDNGKTIIYISDKSKEAEIRLRYELHMKSRFPSHSAKYHS